MNIIIYEEKAEDFYPLCNLFPQFDIRLGARTISEHIREHVSPYKKHEYLGRKAFKLKTSHDQGPYLYISSRAVPLQKLTPRKIDTNLVMDSQVVGFIKHQPPYPQNLKQVKNFIKQTKKSQAWQGIVLNTPWDIIHHHMTILGYCLKQNRKPHKTLAGVCLIGRKTRLHMMRSAVIHKSVTIDTTNGPVFIDRKAEIRPYTTIIGPSYIGAETIVDRAKVIKSSIGPGCRIGGEVEACIFQGYANKYHEGFIGHSFIGEWVNLGALTTNSDLKNNYHPVKVQVGKKRYHTSLLKLGCFVGDHTKLGIGSLIPTGAVIGSFVNFSGGGLMPRYSADFRWITSRKKESYKIGKAIETAKLVMKRRDKFMTEQYEDIIRRFYHDRIRRRN